MTKIAQAPPPHCASCYGVTEGSRYIDFEAYYDGPVIPGAIPKPVDDLILCESCLKEAFDLLDLRGESNELQRIYSLLERAEADIEAKDRMIGRLRLTNDELVEHPIKNREGASRFVGLDEEIRGELERRRSNRLKVSKRIKAGIAKARESKPDEEDE